MNNNDITLSNLIAVSSFFSKEQEKFKSNKKRKEIPNKRKRPTKSKNKRCNGEWKAENACLVTRTTDRGNVIRERITVISLGKERTADQCRRKVCPPEKWSVGTNTTLNLERLSSPFTDSQKAFKIIVEIIIDT